MAENSPEKPKEAPPGGLWLGALGLSPSLLLVVALLALLVWWFYDANGMPLTLPETAVVVLAIALVVFLCRLAWRGLRGRARL